MPIKLSLKAEFGLIVAWLVLTMITTQLPDTLAAVRAIFSLVFVLLLPGFAMQSLFFPKAETLDGAERLGLAFGLSIAVVPPLAIILDYLPVGISLLPIIAAESIIIVVAAAGSVAMRARFSANERFLVSLRFGFSAWWSIQNRANRGILNILLAAGVSAGLAALALVALPRPSAQLTEFYIVSDSGFAEQYFPVGTEAVTLLVGIHNREGITTQYRIVVQQMDVILAETASVQLQPDERVEQDITLALDGIDDRLPILWFLYRNEEQIPYCTLRLWHTRSQNDQQP